MKTARELRSERATILGQARALVEKSEAENRDFVADEQSQYDGLMTQAAELEKRVTRLESLPIDLPHAPAVIRTGLGDTPNKAWAHYFRSGDDGGIRELRQQDEQGKNEYRIAIPTMAAMQNRRFAKGVESRATDEVMDAGTTADGGAAVPTGLVNQIVTRRNEIRLAERLGVRPVIGIGTTVNYPYENADPAVFAATSEQVDALSNTYERDRATLNVKAFTLAKKTKKLELTEELLEDEDANLMAFIGDHIGRAIALTHNTALLTEVASSGTLLKTFASASAIAAGEPEAMVFHNTLGYYLDDGNSIGWVMKPATFGAVKSVLGNFRLYGEQTMGGLGAKALLEYPVFYSGYAGAITASGKSMYFGNWYYVGLREGPALSFIRDPYTTDGVIILKYSFRLVYGVLIAGAIGYGAHPTA
jgi:HK97 family phage major capsid protein